MKGYGSKGGSKPMPAKPSGGKKSCGTKKKNK
jgi:hypothetical protein